MVDPALRRPGRFDKIIEVPLPDMRAREMIFVLHCQNRRVAADIDYRLLAKESDGFTGADIEGLIQSALEAKLTEEIYTGNRELKPVSTEDLITEIRKQTREDEPASGPRMYA
jgi:SpoVK/Ycf46/Vps4 family AAA+-type ATPase